jgi:hypothetical protein
MYVWQGDVVVLWSRCGKSGAGRELVRGECVYLRCYLVSYLRAYVLIAMSGVRRYCSSLDEYNLYYKGNAMIS